MKYRILLAFFAFTSFVAAAEENRPWFMKLLKSFQLENGDPTPWAAFLGRLHFLLLHLPIGLLFAVFFVEILGLFRRKQDFRIPTRFILGITVLFTWLAVVTGLLLSIEEFRSKTGELLAWHGTGALILAVILTIAWLIKRKIYKIVQTPDGGTPGVLRGLYVLMILAAMGMIGLVGHYGGSLVHGETYLEEVAPDPIREPLMMMLKPIMPHDDEPATTNKTSRIENGKAEPENGKAEPENGKAEPENGVGVSLATESFYASTIEPIFARSCNKCHGADPDGKRPKGGYDMTKFDELLEAIEPGNPDDSYLVEVIELPLDDDEHMPPEGKAPQLSDLEKEQVRFWVAQGAKQNAVLKNAPGN